MMCKRFTDFKFSRPIIFYPWLIVVLFVLRKFNLFDLHPSWRDILIFLVMNYVVLILGYYVLNFFIRDRLKTWLLVSLFLIPVLYYSRFLDLLFSCTAIFNFLHSLPALVRLLLYLSILILIVYLIAKYKGDIIRLSKYLNVLMILLIIYTLYAIYLQSTKIITLADPVGIEGRKQQYLNDKPPDIYYIILDAYTSNKSLTDYWNYGNVEFNDFLLKKGFYIASDSRTNYNSTVYSVSSSLNMSYLTNIPKTRCDNIAYIKNLKQLIDSSQVIKYAVQNGYSFTNFSFSDIQGISRYYNDFFFVGRNIRKGTVFETIFRKFHIKWDYDNFYYNQLTLKTINPEIINSLISIKTNNDKPDFVYAHLMIPHDPYIFDESGGIHESDSVFVPEYKEKYLGQLKFVNKLIIKTVDSILNKCQDSPPVIIIQGDHGYRYLSGTNKVKESATIFNAYYFPDKDYSKIYKTISPVNTFRVLFDKYLNAGFPILKDTTQNAFYY
jgi:hypothetical protein